MRPPQRPSVQTAARRREPSSSSTRVQLGMRGHCPAAAVARLRTKRTTAKDERKSIEASSLPVTDLDLHRSIRDHKVKRPGLGTSCGFV